MNANEVCFQTGNYSYECNCNLCPHQKECNGSDADDYKTEEEISDGRPDSAPN